MSQKALGRWKELGIRWWVLSWLGLVAAAGALVLASLGNLEEKAGGAGAGQSEVSLPYPPCPATPLEELTNGKAKIFVTSWVTGRLHQALVPPSSPPVRFLPPPGGL